MVRRKLGSSAPGKQAAKNTQDSQIDFSEIPEATGKQLKAMKRANFEEWMEAARSEPIKISRKSGEAFVLLNADSFEKMQIELARLQGINRGLMDVAQGRVAPSTDESARDTFARAKVRAIG